MNDKELGLPTNLPDAADSPTRLHAAWSYYSGNQERDKKRALENGDLPWRILRYQRIIDPESLDHPISQDSFVRPKTFAWQMKLLAKRHLVISLDELVRRIEEGQEIAPNTVAITFDGGYFDNYLYAFKTLRRYGLPATIFLPTSFIDTENIFMEEKIVIGLLFLKDRGEALPELPFLSKRETKALEELAPGRDVNEDSLSVVIQAFRRLPLSERLSVFASLGEQVAKHGDILAPRAFLSWFEVKTMARAGISFGSYSAGEFIATDYMTGDFADNIRESYLCLYHHELKPSRVFSFPRGVFDESFREMLKKAGLPFAVAASENYLTDEPEKKAAVLPRVFLTEHNSYAPELFFERLNKAQRTLV